MEERDAEFQRARARFDEVAARAPVETGADILASAIVNWVYAAQCYRAISSGSITEDQLISPLRMVTATREELVVEQAYPEQRELMAIASNGLYAALGALSIAADSAMNRLGPRDPTDVGELGSARNIVYMLRCAFAHDPLRPQWECRGQFRRRYEVRELGLALDAAALDGHPLRMADVGDVPRLYQLFQLCLRALVAARA